MGHTRPVENEILLRILIDTFKNDRKEMAKTLKVSMTELSLVLNEKLRFADPTGTGWDASVLVSELMTPEQKDKWHGEETTLPNLPEMTRLFLKMEKYGWAPYEAEGGEIGGLFTLMQEYISLTLHCPDYLCHASTMNDAFIHTFERYFQSGLQIPENNEILEVAQLCLPEVVGDLLHNYNLVDKGAI